VISKTTSTRIVLVMLTGMFSILTAVEAEFNRGEWTRRREIRIPDQNALSSYVLVELDGKVYAGSQPDLDDLRVTDDQGAEIPSKLVAPTEHRGLETRSVEMLDLARETDGVTRFTLDLGESPERHNRLEINTDSHNFSRQVRIEISDDNRRWAETRNDGYIFDFSRDASARYLEITYPVSTKRYLRASILNGRESPIEIDGASVQFSSEQEESLKDWPATIIARSVDANPRASVILIDLGYEKLPSSRIEFQTEATNFHRQVEIEGSNQSVDPRASDRRYWSTVGGGQIFSIELDRVNRKRVQLSYPEARYRYLRVRILDYDDQPLEVAGLKVSGRAQRLLFRREPGRSYELYYGAAAAAAPRYDLAQLSSYLDLSKLEALGLADELSQPPAPKPSEPWLEKQPIWLWATLALAALLLGGLIFRLARMTSD
jgi:hypothetical protein